MEKMSDNRQLLAQYAENGSESAFRELVDRYVDLVHSAATRLVNGDTHLAQDVTQTVFIDLARMARTISRDAMLGGWLHRHTCFVASKVMRGERRRQHRERQAVEMNQIEDHSSVNLRELTPILDQAINDLGAEDRKAILLRYFEQRDFRSVGEALASNEDAARKRVTRALEKLHTLLSRRGVALSAAALGTALGTQAVCAAPAGMAAGMATTALASAATSSAIGVTLLNVMSMTKVKLAVAGALVLTATVPYAVQHSKQDRLRQENESLRQQVWEIDQLRAENDRLAKLAPRGANTPPPANEQFRELLKLRGEVGRLRMENAMVTAAIADPKGPSALMTANPEMLKAIRAQQKASMGAIYEDFLTRLPREQADKLVDLLVDHVTANIEHITTVLREKKSGAERDSLFAAQELVLHEKVQALVGPEALAQFQEYTRNLASGATAQVFQAEMTGENTADQAKQLFQVMQEERQRALQSAGLSEDFQIIPSLNPSNIASEDEAEKNLKLLDSIYERVTERAASFLNPEEVQKFSQFRTNAINSHRVMLMMNRKIMSPQPK
jgi:RNA polymerase sigma factor (sigma-70 family)